MNSFHSWGQTRQWTDDEMFDLIDKINQGYMYMDVTDRTHIPISTLWTRYFISVERKHCAGMLVVMRIVYFSRSTCQCFNKL